MGVLSHFGETAEMKMSKAHVPEHTKLSAIEDMNNTIFVLGSKESLSGGDAIRDSWNIWRQGSSRVSSRRNLVCNLVEIIIDSLDDGNVRGRCRRCYRGTE